MGRVFGVFLLIFGIALAAYGLPTTEPEWNPAIERLARPAVTASDPNAAGSPSVTAGPSARSSARSPAMDNGFKSRPVEPRPADRASPQEPAATAVGPMEKLRAAGQARIGAEGETMAIHRPSSATGKLEGPVPMPVEVVRPGVPAAAPSVTAPPVVAAARRESALREKPQDMKVSKPASGATSAVSDRSSVSAGAGAVASGNSISQPTAITKTVTFSLSAGSRPATQLQASSAQDGQAAPANPVLERADGGDLSSGKNAPQVEAAKAAPAAKPRSEISARQLLSQRYAPPVFLGKVAQQPTITRDAPRQRAFKAQEFWAARQTSGL